MDTDRTSKKRRGQLAWWLVAAWVVSAAPASAQRTAARAEELFRNGLSDMEAGKYETGCPQLAESYQLDPVPGALFTLAECEAGWNKLATAIAHYQAFVDGLGALPPGRRARFEERRRIALDKIATLNGSAPELTLEVSAGAPATLLLKQGGEPLESGVYGVARKLDPGDYLFTAELEGAVVWQRSVSLAPGDRTQLAVPWPLPEQPESGTPVAQGAAPAHARRTRLRPWIYASGALGVAGLAVGAIGGGLALAKKNVIEEHCPDRLCDAQGHDAVQAGQRAALASSIGFGVGLAGAAGVVALYFLARRPDARATSALRRELRPTWFSARGGAGLGLEGSFR